MFGQCDVSLGLECKRPENGASGNSSCQCIVSEEDHFGLCKTNIVNGKNNKSNKGIMCALHDI